mmetsp:Transcript_68246/g.222052  ORF Transcript_68246/g.222052 Transcript_68246/m.222052 type:complete len:93 (+) Transcript_68246:132-410(+)
MEHLGGGAVGPTTCAVNSAWTMPVCRRKRDLKELKCLGLGREHDGKNNYLDTIGCMNLVAPGTCTVKCKRLLGFAKANASDVLNDAAKMEED